MNVNTGKRVSVELSDSCLLRLRMERDRLNASQREDDFSQGCKDGSAWAQNYALYADLQTLAESKLMTAESLLAADIADMVEADAEALFGADHTEWSPAYLHGWLHGINVVYDAV